MDTRKPSSVGKKYAKYAKSKKTEGENYNFYDRVMKEGKVVEKFENFVVVENLFAYQIWDGFEVKKHYLVISKNFTETISSFSPAESKEYFEILAKYESKGFSIYSRAPQSLRKTVKHQHTHLIVLDHKKRVRWLFNIAGKILWWRSFSK